MRTLNTEIIRDEVARLFIEANYVLPASLAKRITECEVKETNTLARSMLQKLSDNMEAAAKINVPICQDTGLAVVFIELGQEVYLEGEPLKDAVDQGVMKAYEEGYLRKSIVRDPLFERVNTGDNTPAVLHVSIVPGDKVKITAAPKGFGSENMSAMKMFTPSATKDDIVSFVVDTVSRAGGNPCPPIVVGVGLGGNFEYAAYLAKKALARDIAVSHTDVRYQALEQEMLEKINNLDIGPQGFGGKTTALAVNIETYPTHIAGLPCAVNIGCHVTRHKTAVL